MVLVVVVVVVGVFLILLLLTTVSLLPCPGCELPHRIGLHRVDTSSAAHPQPVDANNDSARCLEGRLRR
jgi:hypothetical protein